MFLFLYSELNFRIKQNTVSNRTVQHQGMNESINNRLIDNWLNIFFNENDAGVAKLLSLLCDRG